LVNFARQTNKVAIFIEINALKPLQTSLPKLIFKKNLIQ